MRRPGIQVSKNLAERTTTTHLDLHIHLRLVDLFRRTHSRESVLHECSLAAERLPTRLQEQEGLEDVHAVLEDLVLDLDPCERGLVCEERDLVSQHLGVTCLNEEGREGVEVAEEGRDVGVRQVDVNVDLAEEALDGVEVIVGLGLWKVVVGLRGNRVNLCSSDQTGSRLTALVVQDSQDIVKSTHGLMRIAPDGKG